MHRYRTSEISAKFIYHSEEDRCNKAVIEKMSLDVNVDEIDVKILYSLIRNARINLKEIAKECGVSNNAIFKRIKSLEKCGAITGYSIIASPEAIDENFGIYSTIWLNVNLMHEDEAIKFLQKQPGAFNIFRCVGSFDILAYCATKNIQTLEQIRQNIKKQEWTQRVHVNIWTDNLVLNVENVEIKTNRER